MSVVLNIGIKLPTHVHKIISTLVNCNITLDYKWLEWLWLQNYLKIYCLICGHCTCVCACIVITKYIATVKANPFVVTFKSQTVTDSMLQ